MGVVYKIILPDNYYYIGSTKDLKIRLRQHKNDGSPVYDHCMKNNIDTSDIRVIVLHESENFRQVEIKILRELTNKSRYLNEIFFTNTMLTLRVYKWEIELLKTFSEEAGFKTVSDFIRAKVGL